MLLFLSYLIASVQRWLAAALLWMLTLRSLSGWSLEVQFFVDRDAAVLVDITNMRTSGLGIVNSSLLVTHSQIRWKLIFDVFGHHIFVFQLTCGIFPLFLGLFLDSLDLLAEWETQVCLSCEITPDASAVSESGEEGGKNPKSVDQLCHWFSKTLLNLYTWKSLAI